jgi:membrane-bound ClpP family serine protease
MRFYRFGIFWAAVLGGYGVVQSVLGLVMRARSNDPDVRVAPSLFLIVGLVSIFFYLLVASFDAPTEPTRERLRPGETITI